MTHPSQGKIRQSILVTGGCGVIGTNLVRYLRNIYPDVQITVLDDMSAGAKTNLSGVDVTVIQGSVTDKRLISELLRKDGIVFHLAARNIVASCEDPIDDFCVNIGGTLNLLMESYRAGIARFIYASSSSVYGNARYLPIHEDDTKTFLNFYSVSKFSGESYCNVYYELYRLPITVLRYSNIYGEYQNPRNPCAGVVAKFIRQATSGDRITIHGDGEQTRDFTYVQDAAEATALCASSPQAVGKTYNIGTGREISINSLARLILMLCNSASEIEYIDRRDIDNIRRRVVNIESIRRDLGWIPRTTLEKGLQRTIEWFR